MYLKKIRLINFKSYEKLEFYCNEKFNIIVGENNIGKSTIYDAVLLWNLAYMKLITSNKKGFYKKTSYNNMKINFIQFSIFRLVNTKDLFKDHTKAAKISLVVQDDDSKEYDLEIELNKPDIENSYIRFTNKHDEFNKFSKYCEEKSIRLHDVINIKITKPISTLLKEEPFSNKAQVIKKTYLGFSNEVLRNKILSTMEYKKFDYLKEKLKNILGVDYTLRFKNDNRDDSEFINMTIQHDNQSNQKEIDLFLLGSGVLHVLEIFSTIRNGQLKEESINLLLLDEPDAHIHANVQSKLIDELIKENNSQIFLITHNDRLINKAEDGQLFYICEDTKISSILNSLPLDDYELVKKGLSALFDTDKVIVLTEGKTDKKLIELAWSKLYPSKEIPYHIVSPGTDSVDTNQMTASAKGVREALAYASTFLDKKIIGLFDNDEAGRREFKGLKKAIFEDYVSTSNIRKHRTKTIWGLCLPLPPFRSMFVTQSSIPDSYFVIEHYFNDNILTKYEMKGSSILDSNVFRIQGNKNNFSININTEPSVEFEHFKELFNKLEDLVS